MTDITHTIANYHERRPGTAALTDLARRAFAEYPGVIVADTAFTEWFVARPGFDTEASVAVWCGDEPIGSVFVTRVPMALGGRWLVVAVVDTVMVAPEHRGRGLARSLMEHAIAACRRAGLAAMQLYTAPGSAGYRLYSSLGFEEWHRLGYWQRQNRAPGDTSAGWKAVDAGDTTAAAARMEYLARSHDGVPLLGEAVRNWRWQRRPPALPATVWQRDGAHGAEVAVSTPVSLTDGRDVVVLKDLVGCSAASMAGLCHRVGAAVYIALADTEDVSLSQALSQAGFVAGQDEAAMLLPLGDAAILGDRSRPWFPLAESVIGA